MTRIGIISDTHGCTDARFAEHFAGCDEIWHAGDLGGSGSEVLEFLEGIAPVVRVVRGNVDGAAIRRECPEVLSFRVEGVDVWMTHIGGYPGRYAPGVKAMLREARPQLMVAGHSHILKVMYDKELGLLHVNPGAAGRQGWQRVRTLVRLKIDGSDISDLEVIELGAG